SGVLVLYDTTGEYGDLGELYAVQAGNLASHFGAWQATPVTKYTPGSAAEHLLTIYVGSTYDEPLPAAFLADVAAGARVLWLGALTYVAEVPFTYVTFDDRYLVLTDLLYELLAPSTPARHRALVRIEDVGPHSDPAQLRQIADYLHSRNVPFAVAVFPVYDDA